MSAAATSDAAVAPRPGDGIPESSGRAGEHVLARSSLRTKTFVLVLVALLVVVGAIGGLARRVLLQGFAATETRMVADHVNRVRKSVQQRVEALHSFVRDYAQWDDAYAYLETRERTFLEVNFTPTSVEHLALAMAVILDEAGGTVFSTRLAEGGEALEAVPQDRVAGMVAAIGGVDGLPARRGVVVLDGEPLLVVAEPVLRSDGSGPARGILLMARPLLGEMAEQIADELELPATFEVVGADTALPADDAPEVVPLDDGHIDGHGVVRAVDGRPALVARLVLPRDLMAYARGIVASLLVGTALVGVLVLGLTVVVLERLLLRRVSRLSAHVRAIRDIDVQELVDDADDELGQVTRAINGMLGSLATQAHRLREAKEAAEQASRVQAAFLAAVTHDLRTPLHAILGYAEILRDDATEAHDAELAANLERIRRSGRYLLDLVNDVLDVTRLEAGRLELHPEPTDVACLLRELLEEMAPVADVNGNRFAMELPAEAPVVAVDPVRLRQILVNLLSNACKFTTDGTVTVALRFDADVLAIAVRDSGQGMTADEQNRLFSAFYQTAEGAKRGGTGLGLSITRRLVECMGGTITVDSAPDRGTTFDVRIPVLRAAGTFDLLDPEQMLRATIG